MRRALVHVVFGIEILCLVRCLVHQVQIVVQLVEQEQYHPLPA